MNIIGNTVTLKSVPRLKLQDDILIISIEGPNPIYPILYPSAISAELLHFVRNENTCSHNNYALIRAFLHKNGHSLCYSVYSI